MNNNLSTDWWKWSFIVKFDSLLAYENRSESNKTFIIIASNDKINLLFDKIHNIKIMIKLPIHSVQARLYTYTVSF